MIVDGRRANSAYGGKHLVRVRVGSVGGAVLGRDRLFIKTLEQSADKADR